MENAPSCQSCSASTRPARGKSQSTASISSVGTPRGYGRRSEWCSKSLCCLIGALIAANIRYGASFREVGDEEVVEAARGANIHDFITSLPEVGWGVCVGGGGGGVEGVAL